MANLKVNMSMTKNPMPEQNPVVRAGNFDEVALGYDADTAMKEAARCLDCKNSPCREGCPVAVKIPRFLEKVREGDFEAAYEIVTSTNSLPAVCGRVCPQEKQCESKCVRGLKGESVGIGRLERFVADWHMAREDKPEITKMGVKIVNNAIIGKSITVDELFDDGFEAVFIGSGAGLPQFLRIPGENLLGVYSANELLTRTNLMKAYRDDYDTPIKHFHRVAVVGAGNVAMDAARVAKRLGAEHVYITYRRGRDELPARKEEVEHAEAEGIEFELLNNPCTIRGDEDGHVTGIELIRQELGEPDEKGRRKPVAIKDSNWVLDVDTVIIAIGTSPNPLIRNTTDGLTFTKKGGIEADEGGVTARPGVFAGGDAVTGSATVILAAATPSPAPPPSSSLWAPAKPPPKASTSISGTRSNHKSPASPGRAFHIILSSFIYQDAKFRPQPQLLLLREALDPFLGCFPGVGRHPEQRHDLLRLLQAESEVQIYRLQQPEAFVCLLPHLVFVRFFVEDLLHLPEMPCPRHNVQKASAALQHPPVLLLCQRRKAVRHHVDRPLRQRQVIHRCHRDLCLPAAFRGLFDRRLRQVRTARPSALFRDDTAQPLGVIAFSAARVKQHGPFACISRRQPAQCLLQRCVPAAVQKGRPRPHHLFVVARGASVLPVCGQQVYITFLRPVKAVPGNTAVSPLVEHQRLPAHGAGEERCPFRITHARTSLHQTLAIIERFFRGVNHDSFTSEEKYELTYLLQLAII